MNNFLKYGIALLIICGITYYAFVDDLGTEPLSIWVVLFFIGLFMKISISLYTSQLFNVSNKIISIIPSNTGNNNNLLERFRLGHQPYSISAKLIDEVVKCKFRDDTVKNVHFRGVYSGFNRRIRTNPGDTLFVGPAHLIKKIGGDFIVKGRLISISKEQLKGYVGGNTNFYDRIVLKNTKHIFVPSTISSENMLQYRSIDLNYAFDTAENNRFENTINWLQQRCLDIDNYANVSWDEFNSLQDRLLGVLRANKAQSITVRDAKEEMNNGGNIKPPANVQYDEQDERFRT